MTNLQISLMLNDIADLLEVQGENGFKVRAYRRVAGIVESMEEDIQDIYRLGQLESIEGIGKGIAPKIAEIIESGKSTYLENLKKGTSIDLLRILTIPGVGPKKARLFRQQLGIETLSQLQEACSKRELRKLPGIGAKTESNILRGIRAVEDDQSSIPLSMAHVLANSLIDRVSRCEDVTHVSASGALRRMADRIDSILLVVGTNNPASVIELVASFLDVSDVEENGDRLVLTVSPGIPVELRLVCTEDFEMVLWNTTGSRKHCDRVLDIVRNVSIDSSKSNIYDDGREIICYAESSMVKTEQGIYEAARMQYVPPELREDSGEVETALEWGIPELLDLSDMRGDLHTHTRWSDGGNTVMEMAKAAIEKGYDYLAICDHSRSLKVAGGLTVEELHQQIKEIRAANEVLGEFRILSGTEVDIKADGTLDFPDELLGQLDIVVASIHTGFNQPREKINHRIRMAMENKYVDVFAHPVGRLIGRRSGYDIDVTELFRMAKDTGTALEINASPDRLDLSWDLARRAKDLGIMLVINTDAHSIDQLSNMHFGVGVARKAWLTKQDIANAYSLDELPFYKKKSRGK